MKKKITLCAVLLTVVVFFANAELKYWPDYGFYSADYIGTTKGYTIDYLYNYIWNTYSKMENTSNQAPINGKLSNEQNQMLWLALSQYDYAPGEFYVVTLLKSLGEYGQFRDSHIVVQIEADRSVTWRGFTCYVHF